MHGLLLRHERASHFNFCCDWGGVEWESEAWSEMSELDSEDGFLSLKTMAGEVL